MQVMLNKQGYVLVTGRIRSDIEMIQCNNGQYRCKASAVIGTQRGQDGKPIKDASGYNVSIWANITAWGDYARVLGGAQKGDGIMAIGVVRTWEHDGKTYKSLVINDDGYLSLSYPMQPAGQPDNASVQGSCEPQAMTDITDDDDGELPF